MCSPRYEPGFVGWTIRTMLRIFTEKKDSEAAQNAVKDAFREDIAAISRENKKEVFKTEIKLIVKLSNKISPTLMLAQILKENETICHDIPLLENEVVNQDEGSTKSAENSTEEFENGIKDCMSALSNLVKTATKSEELLSGEPLHQTDDEVSAADSNEVEDLKETITKEKLENDIDEIEALSVEVQALENTEKLSQSTHEELIGENVAEKLDSVTTDNHESTGDSKLKTNQLSSLLKPMKRSLKSLVLKFRLKKHSLWKIPIASQVVILLGFQSSMKSKMKKKIS